MTFNNHILWCILPLNIWVIQSITMKCHIVTNKIIIVSIIWHKKNYWSFKREKDNTKILKGDVLTNKNKNNNIVRGNPAIITHVPTSIRSSISWCNIPNQKTYIATVLSKIILAWRRINNWIIQLKLSTITDIRIRSTTKGWFIVSIDVWLCCMINNKIYSI